MHAALRVGLALQPDHQIRRWSRVLVQGFSFPKSSRLITKSDYSYVFVRASAYHCKLFTLLVKPGLSDQSRLGLVVAKKVSKNAVDRNRIKRIIRESFRKQYFGTANYDIVVLAKPAAAKVSKEACFTQLSGCWQQMIKKGKTNNNQTKPGD